MIFKGGTSLAKGWNLIQRFSEDIDLISRSACLRSAPWQKGDRPRTEETPGRGRHEHPALTFLPDESRHHWRLWTKRPLLLRPNTLAGRAKFQIACCSKRAPRAVANRHRSLNCVPTSPSFWPRPARLSVPRTKVRFPCDSCISGAHSSRRCSPSIARWSYSSATAQPLGGYARHYYDLFQLAGQPEVTRDVAIGRVCSH